MDATQPLSLQNELQKNQAFWNLLGQSLQGLTFQQSSLAKQVGAGFLHLSLDHLLAISTLIAGEQFASALTLMRPQYEAAVRGAWFSFAASDAAAQEFLNDQPLPKIKPLIEELRAARPEMQGLDEIHTTTWKYLNDYTHGGAIAIKSRLQNGQIESAITEQHAAACLSQARRFGVIAAVWLSDVIGRNDLAITFYERLREDEER